MIPRGKCSHCGRLHRGLPDFSVPYKHYSTKVISDAIDGIIEPETVKDDRPSEHTIARWRLWIEINKELINGILRSFGYRQLGFSEKLLRSTDSLLDKLTASYEDWLETIIRVIYNSGARLIPL